MRLSFARAGIAAAFLHCFLVPTPCRASEPETAGSPPDCREAFENADLELRPSPEPHLLRARELLRRCASPSCRPWMIADCAKSLVDVERRIPTVVLTAHVSGRPILEARVREGTTWLAERLDGRSLEIEPGVHELVLELPSGEEVRARFVVEEGARLQRLDFDVPPTATSPVESPRPIAPPAPSSLRAVPSRAPAWVGTAGVAGTAAGLGFLALGTAFGAVAWHERDSANCDARGLCDPDPLRRASSASTASTVGFVVGGTLLGLGLAALASAHWMNRPGASPAR